MIGETFYEEGVIVRAVIETGGKQYKVTEGDVLFLERMKGEPGEDVRFDKVLACSNEEETDFGKPYLEGASVDGKIIGHGKNKKIIIFKFKSKKGYRRKQGHRQPYTKVRIERIASEKYGVAEYVESVTPEIIEPDEGFVEETVLDADIDEASDDDDEADADGETDVDGEADANVAVDAEAGVDDDMDVDDDADVEADVVTDVVEDAVSDGDAASEVNSDSDGESEVDGDSENDGDGESDGE